MRVFLSSFFVLACFSLLLAGKKKNPAKTISSSIILLTLDWVIMALCRITHGHQSFIHGAEVTETKLTFCSHFFLFYFRFRVFKIKMGPKQMCTARALRTTLLAKYIIASLPFLSFNVKMDLRREK